jgi:hypothetical protein
MTATLPTRAPWFVLVRHGWHVTFKPLPEGRVNVTKSHASSWVSTRLLPVTEARAEWKQLKRRGFESLD